MTTLIDEEAASAAELALKAYVLQSTPEILADVDEGERFSEQTAELVDLTEAPEDAVCSLVIDLMHYSEREKIDWSEDVMGRARKRFRSEPARNDQAFDEAAPRKLVE
ncbi:MAG: hypothetical protein H0X34_08830 [Chthoniobacterales bacterium]|nr:hypothetical protein [Chthoniobacterales bacterium]